MGEPIALLRFRHNLRHLGDAFIARALALAEPRRGQQHSRNHSRDAAPVGRPRRHRRFRHAWRAPALSAQRDRIARPAAAPAPPHVDGPHGKRFAGDARVPALVGRPGRPANDPGIASLTAAERADLKDRGRRLLMLLLDQLNEEPRRSSIKLTEAEEQANQYGRRAAALGASLSATLEAFVRFRGAFIAELAAIRTKATARHTRGHCAAGRRRSRSRPPLGGTDERLLSGAAVTAIRLGTRGSGWRSCRATLSRSGFGALATRSCRFRSSPKVMSVRST